MQTVLIICNNADRYQSLIQNISDSQVKVEVCSYQDLAFYIDGQDSTITVFSTGKDIVNFSKIIILSTSPYHRQNYIFSALACYCAKHQIPMLDDTFSNLDGKLFALWRFWQNDLPTAKTAFGPVDFLIKKHNEFGGVSVLKSVQGTKGKDSYLIKTEDELHQIVNNNPEARYVLQNFIPNDGDWRVVLINFEPKLAIYRSSRGKDFRNNTSVGGDAKLVPLNEVDPRVLELSIASARALDIKIAGADIMQDSQSGEYTVLEVNRTPQLVTGAFTTEKRELLKHLIRS